jgi:hypothetical protein
VCGVAAGRHSRGRGWQIGSVAGEPGRSMAVHLRGDKAGVSRLGGDALDLAAQVSAKRYAGHALERAIVAFRHSALRSLHPDREAVAAAGPGRRTGLRGAREDHDAGTDDRAGRVARRWRGDVTPHQSLRRRKPGALPKNLRDLAEPVERALAQVRAWVEHPFHVVKIHCFDKNE